MRLEKIYHGINSTEYEYTFVGHYGCKGEKRAKRKKKTPEQMARQNQINRENKIRRLIKCNFYPNDLWICLKYPKGTRKSISEFKNDFDKFIRSTRRDYAKRGEPFKYIYRLEVGKRGGLHIHLLCNRIWGTDLLIQKNWIGGLADFTPLYERGGYAALAAYITKPLPYEDETFQQLSFFDEYSKTDIKQLTTYNCSRNLKRPEPEIKEYKRRTVRDLVENGPKARPGYYIDKDSIRIGVNQYTGYSYVHYTEVKIKQEMRPVRYIPEPETRKRRKDVS